LIPCESDLQNRWGARHRVPGGIVPLASRQFKLAVSARRALSSPARGRRFDGNADGNGRRGRQSMAANLYPRSPGLGIQWPWTLGLAALGACTRSGRGPTIPRFTPRLTCAGRPPGSSRCCLRGRACPATQAGSCCSTPARSEPASSGGIHRASPTERVGRFGRAGQRDGSAVCLSRALIAAPEPGRRSRSRALPAGRCPTRPRPRWGPRRPPEPAAARSSWPPGPDDGTGCRPLPGSGLVAPAPAPESPHRPRPVAARLLRHAARPPATEGPSRS